MAGRKRYLARSVALLTLCVALCGCELIADFDRSKIPQPDAGSGPGPGTKMDASTPGSDAAPAPGDDGGTSDDDAGQASEDAGG